MRYIVILLFAFCICAQAICQPSMELTSTQLRQYNEIRAFTEVQTIKIGCFGHYSRIYQKVDSFRSGMSPADFNNYFYDSSHVLKYYSFITTLRNNNDSLAFQFLKTCINDSSKIGFMFSGLNYGAVNFNQLLVTEYSWYVKAKYHDGIKVTHNGEGYWFENRNRKLWKVKQAELNNLLEEHELAVLLTKNWL